LRDFADRRARPIQTGGLVPKPLDALPKISDFAAEFYECCANGGPVLNDPLKSAAFDQASCDAA
jgi:hypothetical protein